MNFLLLLLFFHSVWGKNLFFGWYGYDPIHMNGWTNIAHTNNMSVLIENAHNGVNQLYEVTELYTSQFNSLLLQPTWKHMINTNISLFKQLLLNRTISGFFMGDELMWNGLPYSNLTHASNYLRRHFPTSFIWENEAAYAIRCNTTYGRCFDKNNKTIHITDGIPPALSAISTDMYHMTPYNNFVNTVKDFYKQWIYPKLHKGQKVFTIPGAFGSNVNSNCDYDCYDTMCAIDAVQYYNWALEDHLVIGMNPWNWFNCTGCVRFKDEIGALYMNITKNIWKNIGETIINNYIL